MELTKITNENFNHILDSNELLICEIYDTCDSLYYLSSSILRKLKTQFFSDLEICEIKYNVFISQFALIKNTNQYTHLNNHIIIIKDKTIMGMLPSFCNLERVVHKLKKYL